MAHKMSITSAKNMPRLNSLSVNPDSYIGKKFAEMQRVEEELGYDPTALFPRVRSWWNSSKFGIKTRIILGKISGY